ncbi:free fatty acid receptor 2 isoform X2 [Ailuropoda melanoleuca]|uniref:free fatty acid receptor 2 isoform X2 n=1 Tax=Ailuropoda melanoleuca TaxID=9646 RepID=UPI00149495F7|nr:free fatty acid receptor 2 isoform X2 [Ailuropoda melanoleuca]
MEKRRMALEPRSRGLLSFYIIYFLTGLPANLVALWAFVGRVRQPQPAPVHILLLSLTLADLLLLLLLPFKMIEAAYDFRWPLGDALCVLTAYGFYSSIYCSTWLLAGIGIERYRSVAFPVQYQQSRRPVYGVIASLVSFLLSFGHCSIVIIVHYLPTNNTGGDAKDLPACYENFTPEQLDVLLPVRLELCLVLFFIPMAVTIFCYWRFVRIMLSRPQVGRQKRWRAMGLAAVTLFNFLVCFGPYNVSHVVGFFQKKSELWRACAVLLSAFNACVDPLIFYFSSSAVRKAFDKRLRSLQSWGASLSGYCRKRAGEPAAERKEGSLGMANINFTGD